MSAMYTSHNFLFELQHGQKADSFGPTPQHMVMAKVTWDRLTSADLSGCRTKSELSDRVEERQALSHEQAAQEVEFWALDKQL
jgi:hypothetical protein